MSAGLATKTRVIPNECKGSRKRAWITQSALHDARFDREILPQLLARRWDHSSGRTNQV